MPQETAESQAEAEAGRQEPRPDEEADGTGRTAPTAKPGGPAPGLAELLTAGSSFLDTLGRLLGGGTGPAGRQGGPAPVESFIGRDEKTGQAYLKLPMPDSQTITRIAEALGAPR